MTIYFHLYIHMIFPILLDIFHPPVAIFIDGMVPLRNGVVYGMVLPSFLLDSARFPCSSAAPRHGRRLWLCALPFFGNVGNGKSWFFSWVVKWSGWYFLGYLRIISGNLLIVLLIHHFQSRIQWYLADSLEIENDHLMIWSCPKIRDILIYGI